MAQGNLFENKAFQSSTPSGVGFNLISQVNSFSSVFDTKPLERSEATQIEKLLVDGFQPGTIAEDQVPSDVDSLKQITAEIKAIGKQGVVLTGERVQRARELLKPYKDGTFTKWLESAFGTRKTGYNALAYFELYTALPHGDLRDGFKKLQQRTAYILASRDGPIEVKIEILKERHNKGHTELVDLIQKKLPIAAQDKRVSSHPPKKLISQAMAILRKLKELKVKLDGDDLTEMAAMQSLIEDLIS
jgi:Uncharacterised protein family (UPF0137)